MNDSQAAAKYPEFKRGMQVLIHDGPFYDLVGEITEVDSSNEQLIIQIKIFGRKTPVLLKFSQVTPQTGAGE